MIPRGVSDIVIVLVSLIWAVNFFAPFFLPSYHPDPSINGIFGAIVGGALALTRHSDPPPPPQHPVPAQEDNPNFVPPSSPTNPPTPPTSPGATK